MASLKTYKHVGTQPIDVDGKDVAPGAVFTADLAPEQEAFYLKIGAIEKVAAVADAKAKK